MKDLKDKVAVVTGGASGIGKCLGQVFAREGMKVVLADVEPAALDATVAEMREAGHEVTGVVTDVTKLESVQALAQATLDAYGGVHVVCNNAGIGTDETTSQIWNSPETDWRWAMNVNVFGVINGIKAFVPIMMERGEEGHVINTSSGNGGLFPIPTTPIYAATKAAVTCITEVLHGQLEMCGANIKASVLYPGPNIVRTNIFTAFRNRPEEFPYEREPDGPPPTLEDIRGMMEGMGMEWAVTEPEEVAEHALEGLREGQFWILPMNERTEERVRERVEGMLTRTNPPLQFM